MPFYDISRLTPIPSDEGSYSGSNGAPVGVTFHWETLNRKGARGDNWCMTWAADDSIYTMMDDGIGFQESRVEWGAQMLRITGGEDFSSAQVTPTAWPTNAISNPFYAYGIYSVNGRIYTWLWKSHVERWYGYPIANRLIYTDDFGKTLYRWDGTRMTAENYEDTDPSSFFFYKTDPKPKAGKTAYAFNWLAFCQNGKDNSEARDDFVYMYAVEQYDPTRLSLIRVPKDRICDRSAYEYFKELSGIDPVWTKDLAERGPTIVYPEKNYNGDDWLWCSWHPSVVYNKPLDRYIMVSYGISDGQKNFFSRWNENGKHSATVGMWHAKNPWGPWTQFYFQPEWKTPGDPPREWRFHGDASRTYQFKLNPKWIHDNGRTMYMIWSDAGGLWGNGHNGHSSYWYRWNQVKITLRLAPEAP